MDDRNVSGSKSLGFHSFAIAETDSVNFVESFWNFAVDSSLNKCVFLLTRRGVIEFLRGGALFERGKLALVL